MFDELAEAVRARLTFAPAATQAARVRKLLATDPRRALVAAGAVHDRFPESLDALGLWADCNWHRGHFAEADRAYRLWGEQAPESAAAWMGQARCARASGHVDRQRLAAQRALELDPGSSAAVTLLVETLEGPAAWNLLRAHDPARGAWFAEHEIRPSCSRSELGQARLIPQGPHCLLELAINGRPVLAACDTGTSGLIIAAHEADPLGLLTYGQLACARSVRLGDAEFRDVVATVLPFPEHFGFGVLFGAGLFHDAAVEADPGAGQFRWSPSDPGAGGGSLWLCGEHWVIPVRMDGHDEMFVVDTGSPHTLVDGRLLPGEPFRGTHLPFRHVATMQGPQEVFYAPRTFLEGERFSLFHDCLTLPLLPGLPDTDLRPSGVLGLDVVGRVRLDYPARRAMVVAR